MKHALVIAILSVVGCGASSTPSPNAATAGNGSNEECHEETQAGSTIPRRVCRSKARSDAERNAAQELMSTPRQNNGQPVGN